MSIDVGWDIDPVVASWPGLPSLRGVVRADVAVIGLGGSGLAAIGEVLRRGLSVVGIDAGRVATGAAGRNGGFLLGGPAIAVHRAATGWGLSSALALYRETLDEIAALSSILGPEVIRPVGSLRLAGLPGEPIDEAEDLDRRAELIDCREQLRVMTEHGIAAQWYAGALGEGLFLPDDAAMNPARRALGLATLYRGNAALFENSPVLSIDSGSVRTRHGQLLAGLIVVAVDGKLELLLPELVGRVRTARLQMLAAMPTAPATRTRLTCPVYGRWGFDYAQQDAAGRLYVGGGRDIGGEAEWTTASTPTPTVQDWIDKVAVRFAAGPVTVTHRWGASVGYTADARSVVAEVRPGVVACGGYNGTGNLVGPIAARAAVSLGLDGARPSEYFSG